LLGSVPFGYWLTKRATGKNIMELGSGNIGSTNVKRVAGKRISVLTQLCDMGKGLFPVMLVLIIAHYFPEKMSETIVYLVALAAILGHNFSIYLRMKGGKGVNTTLGAAILLAPYPVLISVGVYFLVKWRTKFVSLGSILLAITLPISDWLLYPISLRFYFLTICALLILLRHLGNIKRLLHGVENR
jgi:glycerol-3-phosphate acyltransferase PlsY